MLEAMRSGSRLTARCDCGSNAVPCPASEQNRVPGEAKPLQTIGAFLMRYLLIPILCAAAAGCATQSGPTTAPTAVVSGTPKPRIGKVTKEMILLDGGSCDSGDICFDRVSRQDYDCDVEFYCVPTRIGPK